MRKLSEYRDGDALDLLADIMEPAAEIMIDDEVRKAFENDTKLHAASVAIKRHKDAVLQILATLDGVPVEEYHCNIFTLPARVVEILNDEELLSFFTTQAQMTISATSSGPVTETIEDGGTA